MSEKKQNPKDCKLTIKIRKQTVVAWLTQEQATELLGSLSKIYGDNDEKPG
jgi:hypothetical protein